MFSCCRFLKARKFDTDKTVQMWDAMLHWRKEYGVDSILKVNFDSWLFSFYLLKNSLCTYWDPIIEGYQLSFH